MRSAVLTVFAIILIVGGFRLSDHDESNVGIMAFGFLLLYLSSIDDRLQAILNELKNRK